MIYSGRLGPEKNLDFLVHAFAGTAEAVPDAHLLVVGGGPEETALRQLADQVGVPGRVHFTGMLPHEQLPRYLAMGDIFVTASVTEVHPLSVIEAMAAGLPVLGIHSVGVGDIVEEGLTGFLSSQNQAAFASLLTRLCMDSSLRQAMGAAARAASAKYDIERTTNIMLKRYESLLFEIIPRRHGLRFHLRSLAEKLRT